MEGSRNDLYGCSVFLESRGALYFETKLKLGIIVVNNSELDYDCCTSLGFLKEKWY